MAGSFWNKLFGNENGLPGPKGIPDSVGRHLVTVLKKNPDWVWKLMAVVRSQEGKKGCFDVRVYESAQAITANVKVRDFLSLDNHPELILFEGWFDKNNHKADLTEKKGIAA